MLFRDFLQEVTTAQKIKEFGHESAVEFLESDSVDDIDNYAVTMTKIPKVGVNPRPEHNTPIGVYFYPARYYLNIKTYGEELPYMENAAYINIIKFNGGYENKILDISALSKSQFDSSMDSLKKYYSKTDVDSLIEESKKKSSVKTPGGRLWYVTMKLSEGSSSKWNAILRKLGFGVVIDNGFGIMHQNEPTQGFLLTGTAAKVIKRIDNSKEGKKMNAEEAYKHAMYVISRRYTEGEGIIAKDPHFSFLYARDVIKGPFPKGEDAIADIPYYAYNYVIDVIGKRFPKGEDAIMSDPDLASKYTKFLQDIKS